MTERQIRAKELREATQIVISIQKDAIVDFAEAKVQIEQDFKYNKARRDEVLNLIGIKTFHKSAQKGNQEAMVQLLFRFSSNLTGPLQKEIEQKGTDGALLKRIVSYAEVLKNTAVSQKTLKANVGKLQPKASKPLIVYMIALSVFAK